MARNYPLLKRISGVVPIAWQVAFQVFVGFRDKAGGAEAEKDQVPLTGIRDPLATVRGDKHYVSRVHFLGRQAADLHAALSFQDDVTLDGVPDPVPAGGGTRGDSSPGDGSRRIIGGVGKFQDVAAFRGKKFPARIKGENHFFHFWMNLPFVLIDARPVRAGNFFVASPFWVGTHQVWYGRRVFAKGFSKGTPDPESGPKVLILFIAGPYSETFEASQAGPASWNI